MATETITPLYINMPKPGKSYGSVKLANGNKFVGRAEVLGMMTKGNTYSVETEAQDWTNGTVNVITKATLANGAGAAQPGNGADPYEKRPTPPIDAERMFVAGITNALLPKIYEKLGAMDSDKIVAVVTAARRAWAETFGKKEPEKKPKVADPRDFNDDIPL